MTHSVHPYAHRLGIIRDWQSRWFGARGKYQEYLKADVLLREYLTKRLRGYYVDGVDIERGAESLRITVRTSRPGLVIGRSGEGATKLKSDIQERLRAIGAAIPREFKLDIDEVKNPEAHAGIVGYMIAEGLEKRLPFRRVAKQAIEKSMAAKGVQGVKVVLSGRLGGADMGRRESFKAGQVPLTTLRADVDFAREKAYLSYGVIGIKVWIYRGEVFES
ncbi:MAG TPA: 30S ribosomal protein S3 [Candidatus Vogelbacteria bacterium]|uniref:Small ribosomal subunit protein uS3 n=2 Tax=root TaxID=1 RepID=A0A1G2QJV9_9BACT|nr:30S ribosomal protein S3 [uncultured organism]KKW22652.1 MAG: 30S ribosomal protein S3 [Parcubacteria group bacterium GW2011_GWC1_51_35]KKW24827.1 MAG: 30S ribosomal protein S3 [Parcubacteria group bacterium GW2011_GWF2_52_12]KKW27836.1 MAG: 30S ribosomal protein S3 [Parcubacteria group bacterium GW2011_GWF1_52_5]KKW33909.1 MAG: 30S ribosomal protein S3 [Parcubacteria group bacterium GW2011_GWB1_53_43]KKW38292.1 MAG: 30S ribosomal protein S3 [Parcubacteria group bacterium GW2011_GWA1_54_88]